MNNLLMKFISIASFLMAFSMGTAFALTSPVHVNYLYNATYSGGHIWQKDAFANITSGLVGVSEGGIIYVYGGNYTENVVINKSVQIIGRSTPYPVVKSNGNGNGDSITIIRGNVSISGLDITNEKPTAPSETQTSAILVMTAIAMGLLVMIFIKGR